VAKQTTEAFSLIEVRRRLQAAKEHLQRFKTQRVLFLAPKQKILPCIQLQGYDCLSEYNFVNSIPLTEELMMECVKDNRELFVDDNEFDFHNVQEYAASYYVQLKRLFCLTSMCFVNKHGEIDFKSVVCLGSLHHAPRILYRAGSKTTFFFDKLQSYDDLQ
jgi:hypothetical protein